MIVMLNTPGLVAIGLVLFVSGLGYLLASLLLYENVLLGLTVSASAMLILCLGSVMIFSQIDSSSCETPNVK